MMKKFLFLCVVFADLSLILAEASSYENCDKACLTSPYMVQDLETCECFCGKSERCPNTKYWNSTLCDCACMNFKPSCRHPYMWSEKTCQCLCPETRLCRGNQTAEAPRCVCECHNKAEADACLKGLLTVWNRTSCTCQSDKRLFGDLLSSDFSFTDWAKSLFNSTDDDEYDEDEN